MPDTPKMPDTVYLRDAGDGGIEIAAEGGGTAYVRLDQTLPAPSLADIERLREALAWLGVSFPVSLEEFGARYHYWVYALAQAAIGSKLCRSGGQVVARGIAALVAASAAGTVTESQAADWLGMGMSEFKALSDVLRAEGEEAVKQCRG